MRASAGETPSDSLIGATPSVEAGARSADGGANRVEVLRFVSEERGREVELETSCCPGRDVLLSSAFLL